MRKPAPRVVHRVEMLPAVPNGSFDPVPLCRVAGASEFTTESQAVTCKNCRRQMRRTAWWAKLAAAYRSADA